MNSEAVDDASSDGLLESITGRAGDEVAKKIAEFKEPSGFNKGFVVGGLDFNADGTKLATNGQVAPPEVHVWEWRVPSHAPRILGMRSPAGSGEAIRFNGDGSLLAVGHGPNALAHDLGVVQVWNTQTWAAIHDIDNPQGGGTNSLAFSTDGKLLVRTIENWRGPNLVATRTETWEQAWELELPRPWLIRKLALSPDGQFTAVAGETFERGHIPIVTHPQILIVDLSTRKLVRTIANAFPDNNEIKTLAWSPDGKSLAAGGLVTESAPGPDAVRIFDPISGEPVVREAGTEAFVSALSYSPDGRYLAEGYIDGKVRIWDGLHKQLLQSIPVNDHFHTALTISRDSRYLAVAAGFDVSIWELR
jgi:WD40 repeat protein